MSLIAELLWVKLQGIVGDCLSARALFSEAYGIASASVILYAGPWLLNTIVRIDGFPRRHIQQNLMVFLVYINEENCPAVRDYIRRSHMFRRTIVYSN
jgi:hypothetical protein